MPTSNDRHLVEQYVNDDDDDDDSEISDSFLQFQRMPNDHGATNNT